MKIGNRQRDALSTYKARLAALLAEQERSLLQANASPADRAEATLYRLADELDRKSASQLG
jgi:phosphohistidine phosphatase SixA